MAEKQAAGPRPDVLDGILVVPGDEEGGPRAGDKGASVHSDLKGPLDHVEGQGMAARVAAGLGDAGLGEEEHSGGHEFALDEHRVDLKVGAGNGLALDLFAADGQQRFRLFLAFGIADDAGDFQAGLQVSGGLGGGAGALGLAVLLFLLLRRRLRGLDDVHDDGQADYNQSIRKKYLSSVFGRRRPFRSSNSRAAEFGSAWIGGCLPRPLLN